MSYFAPIIMLFQEFWTKKYTIRDKHHTCGACLTFISNSTLSYHHSLNNQILGALNGKGLLYLQPYTMICKFIGKRTQHCSNLASYYVSKNCLNHTTCEEEMFEVAFPYLVFSLSIRGGCDKK